MKYGVLAGLVLTTASHASIDLKANEQPLPVTVDQQAVAKIPKGYQFVEPGTLTVAISALSFTNTLSYNLFRCLCSNASEITGRHFFFHDISKLVSRVDDFSIFQ